METYQKEQKEAARRRMMFLFQKANITDEMRHDLVFAWTNGRTNSSTELELSEMRDIIWKFENNFDAPCTKFYIEQECKKLRSQVLKIATETGIKEPNDFGKFNRFMKEYSILKKELTKYSLEELHLLVKQFHGIKRNFDKSADMPGTKAWNIANGFTPINSN